MKVQIISSYGFYEALLGLGLSYGTTSDMDILDLWNYKDGLSPAPVDLNKLKSLAKRLACKGHGHDKFLRMMIVYLDIQAPLYWWKQFDTYKVGTVASSESTMHTLMSKPITKFDFEEGYVPDRIVHMLEHMRQERSFERLNAMLPQSYLQRRVVQCNYAVLAEVVRQRKGHKLREWQLLIEKIKEYNQRFNLGLLDKVFENEEEN